MERVVRREVQKVLERTLEIFTDTSPNSTELRDVSFKTIHNASLYQDEDSVSVAILIYSLSKIIERNISIDRKTLRNLLACAVGGVDGSDPGQYRECISKIFDVIRRADSKFAYYVQEVVAQAKIKKGSEIVQQGVSAARTAQLLGISLWELHNYLSATRISDQDTDISPVRERLKFTRKLFHG